jgi:hypothetical protein
MLQRQTDASGCSLFSRIETKPPRSGRELSNFNGRDTVDPQAAQSNLPIGRFVLAMTLPIAGVARTFFFCEKVPRRFSHSMYRPMYDPYLS